MNAKTDSMMNEASEHVLRGQPRSPTVPMTRWQEAEDKDAQYHGYSGLHPPRKGLKFAS